MPLSERSRIISGMGTLTSGLLFLGFAVAKYEFGDAITDKISRPPLQVSTSPKTILPKAPVGRPRNYAGGSHPSRNLLKRKTAEDDAGEDDLREVEVILHNKIVSQDITMNGAHYLRACARETCDIVANLQDMLIVYQNGEPKDGWYPIEARFGGMPPLVGYMPEQYLHVKKL